MREEINDNEIDDVPASLRHKKRTEPVKSIQLRLPVSWAEELMAFSREYDQDVSTFLREAVEDWLRRARKVRRPIVGS